MTDTPPRETIAQRALRLADDLARLPDNAPDRERRRLTNRVRHALDSLERHNTRHAVQAVELHEDITTAADAAKETA